MDRHQSLQIIALVSLALLSVCTAENSCGSQTTAISAQPSLFYSLLHHLDSSSYAWRVITHTIKLEIRGTSSKYISIEFSLKTVAVDDNWGLIIELIASKMVSLMEKARDSGYYTSFNYEGCLFGYWVLSPQLGAKTLQSTVG